MVRVITLLTVMSKPFHQTAPWQRLSKEHKTLRCRKCGTDKHIESDHILSQDRFKMFRLWRFNLQYLCGVEAKGCNRKKGESLDWWYWKTYLLLMVYGAMKGIYWLVIILYFSLTTAVMVMDLTAGGFETRFTGQIIIESWEQLQQLKELL